MFKMSYGTMTNFPRIIQDHNRKKMDTFLGKQKEEAGKVELTGGVKKRSRPKLVKRIRIATVTLRILVR